MISPLIVSLALSKNLASDQVAISSFSLGFFILYCSLAFLIASLDKSFIVASFIILALQSSFIS